MASGGAAAVPIDETAQAAALRAAKVRAIRSGATSRTRQRGKVLPFQKGAALPQFANNEDAPDADFDPQVQEQPFNRLTPREELRKNRLDSRRATLEQMPQFANLPTEEDLPFDDGDAANTDNAFAYQDDEDDESGPIAPGQSAQGRRDPVQIAKLKSEAKKMAEQELRKAFEKGAEKIAKMGSKQAAKRSTDLVGKGASSVDVGNFAFVIAFAGWAVNNFQLLTTLFKKSIPDEVQSRMLGAPLDLGNEDGSDPLHFDWLSLFGTIFFDGLIIVILAFVLLVIIGIILTGGALCMESFTCQLFFF